MSAASIISVTETIVTAVVMTKIEATYREQHLLCSPGRVRQVELLKLLHLSSQS